jgi:hypothetical protein
MIENSIHLRKRSLVDQERHLYLEMPTSERLMPGGRERTLLQSNIKAKPEALNLSKTDPSMWS